MVDEAFKVWQRVLAHASRIGDTTLQSLFSQDPTRAERFNRTLSDSQHEIIVDFSKQLIESKMLARAIRKHRIGSRNAVTSERRRFV